MALGGPRIFLCAKGVGNVSVPTRQRRVTTLDRGDFVHFALGFSAALWPGGAANQDGGAGRGPVPCVSCGRTSMTRCGSGPLAHRSASRLHSSREEGLVRGRQPWGRREDGIAEGSEGRGPAAARALSTAARVAGSAEFWISREREMRVAGSPDLSGRRRCRGRGRYHGGWRRSGGRAAGHGPAAFPRQSASPVDHRARGGSRGLGRGCC